MGLQTYQIKLGERTIGIKALKDQAGNIAEEFKKLYKLSQYYRELTGVVGKSESSCILYSICVPHGIGIADPAQYQTDLTDLIGRLPELLTIENARPFIAEARLLFNKHILVQNKRITEQDILIRQAETTAREAVRSAEVAEWRQGFVKDSNPIVIPAGMMSVYLELTYDNSDMMTDYFDSHAQTGDDMLLAIVPKQSEKEALCRRILGRYPELNKLTWEWHTENYSMGHGNYLISGWTDHEEKITTYAGYKNPKTRYEVRCNAYSKDMLVYRDYPGVTGNETPEPITSPGAVTIRRNEEHNGIEVLFPGKPDISVLDSLKALGFRWSKYQSLWYAKFTDNLMAQVTELLTPAVKS